MDDWNGTNGNGRAHGQLAYELAKKAKPVEWVVDGLLGSGCVLQIPGSPKQGRKSLISIEIALCVATGEKLFGHFTTHKRPVLYTAIEDGEDRVARRLKMLGALERLDNDFDRSMFRVNFGMEGYSEGLEFIQHEKGLWIPDPLSEAVAASNLDENKMGDMTRFFKPIREANQASRSATAIPHHMRKAGDVMRGSTAIAAAGDGWLELFPHATVPGVMLAKWTTRDSDPGQIHVKITFEGGRMSFSLVNDTEVDEKSTEIMQSVREAIADSEEGLSAKTLMESIGFKGNRRIAAILTCLAERGEVEQVKVGKALLWKKTPMLTRRIDSKSQIADSTSTDFEQPVGF